MLDRRCWRCGGLAEVTHVCIQRTDATMPHYPLPWTSPTIVVTQPITIYINGEKVQ